MKKFFQGLWTALCENKLAFVGLGYSLLLHFALTLTLYLVGINDSFNNPLMQGAWGWLALYGIFLCLPGVTSNVLISILLFLQTLEGGIALFLGAVFNLSFGVEIFSILSVSSLQEIKEFTSTFLSFKTIFGILCGVVLLGSVLRCVWKAKVKRSAYLWGVLAVLILPQLINTIRFTIHGEYEDIYYRNRIAKAISSYGYFKKSMSNIYNAIKHPAMPSGVTFTLPPQGDMTAVLVIGESATRFHHGIYGYPRNTTPCLEANRDKLQIFQHAVSPYCVTVKSISYMLTDEMTTSPGEINYTMLHLFKKAGFHIAFISNQDRWGRFDSPIALIASTAHKLYYQQQVKPNSLDDMLLPEFKRQLQETKGPRLIILHLIGSHGKYHKRVPDEFKRFNKETPFDTAVSVDDWKTLGEYDDTIRFTDRILGEVIRLLEERKEPAFMLYTSDHGDSPEHPLSAPRASSSISASCYEVPLFFYSNPCYRKQYPQIIQNMKGNLDKTFLNDAIMFPFLSAAQITFDDFPQQKNLFSSQFVPPEKCYLGNTREVYKRRPNPFVTIDKQ